MGVSKKSIPQFPWLYEPVHPDDWIIFMAAGRSTTRTTQRNVFMTQPYGKRLVG